MWVMFKLKWKYGFIESVNFKVDFEFFKNNFEPILM